MVVQRLPIGWVARHRVDCACRAYRVAPASAHAGRSMFGVVEAEIAAENRHRTNEIEQGNLEKYHDQLNSFNTQATLILGFALASLNADNLMALGDDQSKYCMYKAERQMWGFIFGISTVACLSISFTCIAASFYLIIRSQHFALNVGVRPALAMVRTHRSRIIVVFVVGLLFFFLSAIATIWIYLGQANWRSITAPTPGSCSAGGADVAGCADGSWGSKVMLVDDGSTRITCLNPHSAEDHDTQETVTRAFAIVVTTAFLISMISGAAFLAYIKWDFDRLERSLLNANNPVSSRLHRAGGGRTEVPLVTPGGSALEQQRT